MWVRRIVGFCCLCKSYVLDAVGYVLACLCRSGRVFLFLGKECKYFLHYYNRTWANERIVEIPIFKNIVDEYKGKKILEIGNVLSNYFFVSHDILDKYDRSRRVIREDVVEYNPWQKYDLIVSISTLEHVGWNEEPKDPFKVLSAFNNIRQWLSVGGKAWITIPLGYNPNMDSLLKSGKIPFAHSYFLKRISLDNQWKEVGQEDVQDIKYNHPFNNANGLFVGCLEC